EARALARPASEHVVGGVGAGVGDALAAPVVPHPDEARVAAERVERGERLGPEGSPEPAGAEKRGDAGRGGDAGAGERGDAAGAAHGVGDACDVLRGHSARARGPTWLPGMRMGPTRGAGFWSSNRPIVNPSITNQSPIEN